MINYMCAIVKIFRLAICERSLHGIFRHVGKYPLFRSATPGWKARRCPAGNSENFPVGGEYAAVPGALERVFRQRAKRGGDARTGAAGIFAAHRGDQDERAL